MKKVLLDTNAYTNLLRGFERVSTELKQANVVFLSVIVIGELLTGFKGGIKEKNNLSILADFINHPKTLTIDVGV